MILLSEVLFFILLLHPPGRISYAEDSKSERGLLPPLLLRTEKSPGRLGMIE